MSTVKMRRVELFVLKRDIDAALAAIGAAGTFQIAERARGGRKGRGAAGGDERHSGAREEDGRAERAAAAASPAVGAGAATGLAGPIERVRTIRRCLGLEFPETVPAGTVLPGAAEEGAVEAMARRVEEFEELERVNAERTERSRELLEEARAFAGLALPFRELDHLSFLAVRIGHLDPPAVASVIESMGERALVLPVDAKGTYVAATTKKGRFALDTELARAGFKPRVFSKDFAGVPPELPEALERELASLESERAGLERRRAELRAELAGPWAALAASFAVAEAIEEVKTELESSAQVYRLEGWVPKDGLESMAAGLDRATESRAAVRSFKPREVEAVRSGEEEVPVLLKRRPFVSSFERLVLSYGTPVYGTVDPSPFVAVFFVILFSIMFGDLGQGFLILAGGLALRFELVPALRSWKKFGPIVIGAGLGSMTMGLLTGSCFANEEWLVPLGRIMTAAILGHPSDRFLHLMPEPGGVGGVMVFFGFTLALGVVINSCGLAINIYNKLVTRRLGEALFAKNGLAGALFFWWTLGLGIRVMLGGHPAWFDALGFGLPLAALVFEEPLQGMVGGHRHEDEGAFAFAIKGFVAVMEAVSYFLSNSLSFLRVGAFALSHLVLSFIVFAMGDMVRQGSPLGIVFEILVVVIGNSIILLLEGMIVAIQVIRLQYYEFLSKFLTETGRPFAPFRFEYRKE